MTSPVDLQVEPLPARCDLRLPDPAAPGVEGALGRANARARDRAVDRWSAAVSGIDARAWGDAPGPGQPATGTTHLHLVGLIDRLGPAALGAHEIALTGIAPAELAELATLDPAGLAAHLEQGAEAVIRRADDLIDVLAGPAEDLSGALAAEVEVAAIVSGPGAAPTSTWYDHDTVFVGLEGVRTIELLAPSDEAPVPGFSADPTGPPAWEGRLEQGQVVVLPRGWGRALAGTGPATWAELRVRRLRGTDVAAFVAGRAGGTLAFREDAPWDPDAVDPDPTSIFGDPDALAARFAELDLDHLSAVATASWMANLRPVQRPAAGAVAGAAAGGPVELAAPGGWVLVDELPHDAAPLDPAHLAVAAAGRLVRIRSDLAEALAALDLPGELQSGLAHAGLLAPARPSPARQ